ncbi:hypothetical protein HDK90DRAFT_167908 [Phyllosticta capitalensis]|uniref:Uncharacterized protein n=1 Tax=Phyllosticta capitalensis TaxID=121624 RepID=A0ABR1YUP1_9PEZI
MATEQDPRLIPSLPWFPDQQDLAVASVHRIPIELRRAINLRPEMDVKLLIVYLWHHPEDARPLIENVFLRRPINPASGILSPPHSDSEASSDDSLSFSSEESVNNESDREESSESESDESSDNESVSSSDTDSDSSESDEPSSEEEDTIIPQVTTGPALSLGDDTSDEESVSSSDTDDTSTDEEVITRPATNAYRSNDTRGRTRRLPSTRNDLSEDETWVHPHRSNYTSSESDEASEEEDPHVPQVSSDECTSSSDTDSDSSESDTTSITSPATIGYVSEARRLKRAAPSPECYIAEDEAAPQSQEEVRISPPKRKRVRFAV